MIGVEYLTLEYAPLPGGHPARSGETLLIPLDPPTLAWLRTTVVGLRVSTERAGSLAEGGGRIPPETYRLRLARYKALSAWARAYHGAAAVDAAHAEWHHNAYTPPRWGDAAESATPLLLRCPVASPPEMPHASPQTENPHQPPPHPSDVDAQPDSARLTLSLTPPPQGARPRVRDAQPVAPAPAPAQGGTKTSPRERRALCEQILAEILDAVRRSYRPGAHALGGTEVRDAERRLEGAVLSADVGAATAAAAAYQAAYRRAAARMEVAP